MNRKQKCKNNEIYSSSHGIELYPKTIHELAGIVCKMAEIPGILESFVDEKNHSHAKLEKVFFNLSGELTSDDIVKFGLFSIDNNDQKQHSLIVSGIYMLIVFCLSWNPTIPLFG
jgi:hypothetical protein